MVYKLQDNPFNNIVHINITRIHKLYQKFKKINWEKLYEHQTVWLN